MREIESEWLVNRFLRRLRMLLRKQDVVFTRESTGAPSVASLDYLGCVWRLTPLLRLLQLLVVRLVFISHCVMSRSSWASRRAAGRSRRWWTSRFCIIDGGVGRFYSADGDRLVLSACDGDCEIHTVSRDYSVRTDVRRCEG